MNPKTGMPEGVLGKGLTAHNLKTLDKEYDEEHGVRPMKSIYTEVSSARHKNETPEERNERKKLVKELRRVIIAYTSPIRVSFLLVVIIFAISGTTFGEESKYRSF